MALAQSVGISRPDPMALAPRWRELRIGIIAAAAVVVGAVLILVFGRVGALHGKKFTLYVTTDGARGVIRGTEVWLAGQRVGSVKNISFRSPSTPPSDRLVLTLSVLDDARPHLRGDTHVQIRSGGSILGDQVVYLSGGTARARPIVNGDTIRAARQSDLEQVSSDAAMASREFPAIVSNVKLLATQLQSTEAGLEALGLGPRLQDIRSRTSRLMTRISESDGTVSLALSNRDLLRARAAHAMAQVDSIRALLASDQHSLGRFRRDSTLTREISRIRAELSEVERLASSQQGTVGRLQTDTAIVQNVHRGMMQLDSLFADIKKHPFRYLVF